MPRYLTIDKARISVALAKAAVDLKIGNVPGAIKSAIDIASAIGWKGAQPPNAEEGAALLAERALLSALLAAFREHMVDAAPLTTTADAKEMAARLTGIAAESPLTLNLESFRDPGSWPVVKATAKILETWMEFCGVREDARSPMILSLQNETPIAIHAELRNIERAGDYVALLDALWPRPGDEAAWREWQWRSYRAKLIDEPRTPLFRLEPDGLPAVSLADMYMRARALCRDDERRVFGRRGYETDDQLAMHRIVWLDQALLLWLEDANPNDTIRVVRGEPGVGKSSFVSIFAAELARKNWRVVVVPMGELSDQTDPLTAIGEWIAHPTVLGFDPLERGSLDWRSPLLLILDGLDELARAGQTAATVVSSFCDSLIDRIGALNYSNARIFLLLCGRPGAAVAASNRIRAESAQFEVLRYVFDPQRMGVTLAEGGDWNNAQSLLRADQRPEWWRRYGRFAGRGWDGLPKVVNEGGRRLQELSEQPVLNYMLAQTLALEGESSVVGIDSVTVLYRRFFDHVLNRCWRRVREIRGAESYDNLKRDNLNRILEETAIAAWHSGDREVKRETLLDHMKKQNILDLFEEAFPDNNKNDISKMLSGILDSFFCAPGFARQETYIFTHKSFREYLTAQRIVREVAKSARFLEGLPSAEDVQTTLGRWLGLCGAAEFDEDLLDMLRAELRAPDHPNETVAAWRTIMARLFQECIDHGPPPSTGWTMRDTETRARNTELAVLAALNACILRTAIDGDRERVSLNWSNKSARSTLHRLIGPDSITNIAPRCLSSLSFRYAYLSEFQLVLCDLNNSDLRSSDFTGADLESGDLRHTNLNNSDFSGAKLERANLSRSNLNNAILISTNLNHAELNEASLANANLTGASLVEASLRGAVLTGSNLDYAILDRADFTGADLTDVTLTASQKRVAIGLPPDDTPAP